MRNTQAGGGSSQSGLSKTDGGLRRRSLDTARHRTAWLEAGPEEAPVRFGWGTRSVQMKKGPPTEDQSRQSLGELRRGVRELRCRTVALRRQRSHVRIVSGAPVFSLFYSAISTPGLKLQLCLIRASKQVWWKIVAEFRRVLSELVKEELSVFQDDGAVSRELALHFVVSTFLTVLTWCLERKPKLTRSQVDAMFRRLVISGIGRSIGAVGRR